MFFFVFCLEHLLSCGEHFLVLVYEKESTMQLVNEIVSCLSKRQARPVVFECGGQSFGTLLEEVQFYKKYPNAVFVVFLSSAVAKNKQLQACFEALVDESVTHSTSVLPIELFGMKSKDRPACLRKYKSIRVFPKPSWRMDDIHEFVEMLISDFESLLHQEMLQNLTRKCYFNEIYLAKIHVLRHY